MPRIADDLISDEAAKVPRMFRRKRKRVKMVLGVRAIAQGDQGPRFDELTYTLDLAVGGVRLGGMEKVVIQPGDVIELRRRNRRARFRVMWVGETGTPRTGQVGLKSIDAPADFWGLEIPTDSELAFSLGRSIRTVSKPAG